MDRLNEAAPRLISTKVPGDLARAVELAAREELITLASFTRRALLEAVRRRQSQETAHAA